MAITIATDIEKMVLARDVLQERIDARVAAGCLIGADEWG